MTVKSAGIRAFIGLSIPTAAREVLEDVQFDLIDLVPEKSVRWIKPENMHLTLFFIGDGVLPDQVAQLCEALDQIGGQSRPFALQLGRIDCFPRQRNPRTLWVGVDGQVRALQSLKKRTDETLADLGWEPEKRRYTPHLTLGYVQDSPAVGRARLPYHSPVNPIDWQVNNLILFHSQKTKHGIRYHRIHTARLADENTHS